MVSRTWSVTLKTSIGSSAAPASNSSVRIGSPNSSSHFDGSGTRPSGPSSGKNGVIGMYGHAEQPGQRRHVADQRVDLLGADDRQRDDRHAGAHRRGDEAAAAEALQLVALGVRLADALEALGPDADQLAAAEHPLGVLGAGQGGAAAARHRADERHPEDQVGAERAQEPAGLVVDR